MNNKLKYCIFLYSLMIFTTNLKAQNNFLQAHMQSLEAQVAKVVSKDNWRENFHRPTSHHEYPFLQYSSQLDCLIAKLVREKEHLVYLKNVLEEKQQQEILEFQGKIDILIQRLKIESEKLQNTPLYKKEKSAEMQNKIIGITCFSALCIGLFAFIVVTNPK